MGIYIEKEPPLPAAQGAGAAALIPINESMDEQCRTADQ
jgi:hypothetical protein